MLRAGLALRFYPFPTQVLHGKHMYKNRVISIMIGNNVEDFIIKNSTRVFKNVIIYCVTGPITVFLYLLIYVLKV